MKECMYSYHYNRKRAIIRRSRSGYFVVLGVIGVAAIFSLYCLSSLVRV
jgi:hypothetical protein